jgi:hypothetical protein
MFDAKFTKISYNIVSVLGGLMTARLILGAVRGRTPTCRPGARGNCPGLTCHSQGAPHQTTPSKRRGEGKKNNPDSR